MMPIVMYVNGCFIGSEAIAIAIGNQIDSTGLRLLAVQEVFGQHVEFQLAVT